MASALITLNLLAKMKISFIFIALFLISCSQHKTNTEQQKQEMIKTDMAMNTMAAKEGFNTAILYYADSNIVKFESNQLPVIGKAALAASFDKDQDTKTLSWKPEKAEVALSGDIGYTWGYWKFVAKDTTYYGNYFTAWKKQPDGNWKVSLDGGNNTPRPE
jgi:ketosteroid isomerase-like protein